MVDFSAPVSNEVIIGTVVILGIIVALGIAAVQIVKRKKGL